MRTCTQVAFDADRTRPSPTRQFDLASVWAGWSVQDDLRVVCFDLETGRKYP